MKNIEIHGLEEEFYIPSVNFNADTGICELSGESYLEETSAFYEPLVNWISQYIEEKRASLTLNIKLVYYNTSSSKKILDLLRIMKDYEKSGGDATVNWFYEDNDIDTIEDIEDFMLITGLKINMVKHII